MTFRLTFQSKDLSFPLRLGQDETSFSLAFGEVGRITDIEAYSGAYTVTPRVWAQELETARKVMSRDVGIEAIPLSEASNASGGLTATIG